MVGLALAAVAVVVVATLLLRPGIAKVEGDTPEERIASIIELADTQPPGAADAIAGAAAEDPSARVRVAALLALERFIAPKYRPVVESALAHADERVRAAAATTLGRFGDTASADSLHELCVKDTSKAVRLAAVHGLEKNPSPKATVRLVQVMEKGKDADVQVRAIRVLGARYEMPSVRSIKPSNAKWWANDVELVKEQAEVISAFRKEYPRHSRRVT